MIRFSLVCPLYNVEPYVDAFLGSVVAQTFDPDRMQIILVDDGSTDGTPGRIDRWCAHRPERFELIRQANGGLSRARNAGLEKCAGEWVLFPDPDDRLPRDYLAQLDKFLSRKEVAGVDIIATRRTVRDEARGILKDTHPLKGMFDTGDRVVEMTQSTQDFVLAVNSGAVRRSAFVETGLRFDPEVRPTFEDALLVGQILLARGSSIGICASATYEWTRRAVGGSITQVAWQKPERYDHVFRVGYLRLLEDARSALGSVPDWAARMVLYDLQWYLRVDRKEPSPIRDLDGAVLDRLHERFAETLAIMDPHQITEFDLCPDDLILTALRSFVEPQVHSLPTARRSGLGEVLIEYEYAGETPDEQVLSDGPVELLGADEADVLVFGRPRLRHRVIRCSVPSGTSDLTVVLNGTARRLSPTVDEPRRSIKRFVAPLVARLRGQHS